MNEEKHPERRLLMAFGLVFVVILVWPYYMRWRYPPPPPGQEPVITEEQIDAPQETPAQSERQTPEVAPPTFSESAPLRRERSKTSRVQP